jgi:signal transduction histidine kinase
LRLRVEAAGGRLVVESSPGAGTRITAALPKVAASVALAA